MCLVLCSLNQHKHRKKDSPGAMCRIYVHQLDSPSLAEEYCDRLYEANMKGLKANLRPLSDTWAGIEPEASYDMYIALMQVSSAGLRVTRTHVRTLILDWYLAGLS